MQKMSMSSDRLGVARPLVRGHIARTHCFLACHVCGQRIVNRREARRRARKKAQRNGARKDIIYHSTLRGQAVERGCGKLSRIYDDHVRHAPQASETEHVCVCNCVRTEGEGSTRRGYLCLPLSRPKHEPIVSSRSRGAAFTEV
jgi:hypothetical protein